MNLDPAQSRLEAILFLSPHPLSSRKLAEFASLADGTQARTLIRRLNAGYQATGSALRVEEVAGGFQLLTRPQCDRWVRKLHSSPEQLRLSQPALETLTIIAYRQPVLRVELEAIRGVQCGEILKQLLERDLVRITGRSDELGRPFQYGTTRRYLQVFGLRSLEELPRPISVTAEKSEISDTQRSSQLGSSQLAGTPLESSEERTVKTAMIDPTSLEQIPVTWGDLLDVGDALPVEWLPSPAEAVRAAADDKEGEDEDKEDDLDADLDDEEEDDEDEDDDEEWEEDDDEGIEDVDWEEEDDEEWDEEDDDDEDDDDWDDEEEEGPEEEK